MNKLLQLLRAAVFYLGHVFVTVFLSVVFMLVFVFLPDRGRHRFVSGWIGFVLFWLRLCCGVRHQVSGLENLPDPLSGPPAVLLSNHQSAWETLLLYRLVFPVAPLLKKELLLIPFFGWALRMEKPIAIDRSNPRSAGKALLEQGVERIRQGYSIIVFPEGTRSPVGQIKRFSRGGVRLAIAAQASVIPIAHNAGHCWPRNGFIKHPGLISMVIGSPISTAEREPSELTEQVENWIRAAIDEMPTKVESSTP
ncbi:MAG: lysophospholipid acyltransferase family protein [Pseudohongiellaceae bacterium]